MGFLLGLSENTVLFLPPHHTIIQNFIKYNEENEVFEDSMQADIIPSRFKDNYQILVTQRVEEIFHLFECHCILGTCQVSSMSHPLNPVFCFSKQRPEQQMV